eukprot:TRINITY_DN24984_c0_g1_i1.p1 TRINITY_DN24984_c0_g1~~TRINITY_DN24984_c0_g1_i1.p1  ORF type:complete len:631 (+),score=99.90 TRINITY_DN24984_c0_g1_i1:31-1923(+)
MVSRGLSGCPMAPAVSMVRSPVGTLSPTSVVKVTSFELESTNAISPERVCRPPPQYTNAMHCGGSALVSLLRSVSPSRDASSPLQSLTQWPRQDQHAPSGMVSAAGYASPVLPSMAPRVQQARPLFFRSISTIPKRRTLPEPTGASSPMPLPQRLQTNTSSSFVSIRKSADEASQEVERSIPKPSKPRSSVAEAVAAAWAESSASPARRRLPRTYTISRTESFEPFAPPWIAASGGTSSADDEHEQRMELSTSDDVVESIATTSPTSSVESVSLGVEPGPAQALRTVEAMPSPQRLYFATTHQHDTDELSSSMSCAAVSESGDTLNGNVTPVFYRGLTRVDHGSPRRADLSPQRSPSRRRRPVSPCRRPSATSPSRRSLSPSRRSATLLQFVTSAGMRRLCSGDMGEDELRSGAEELLFESLPRENVANLKSVILSQENSRRCFRSTVLSDGGRWSKARVVWHLSGSSRAAAAIADNGICCDEDNCACGRYGRGGYVAVTAAKANAYADSDGEGGTRQLFMVVALPEDEVLQGERGIRPSRTVADLPSHPTEYCFVDPSRLHCVLLFTYNWIPTGRREKVATAGSRVSHVVPPRHSSIISPRRPSNKIDSTSSRTLLHQQPQQQQHQQQR